MWLREVLSAFGGASVRFRIRCADTAKHRRASETAGRCQWSGRKPEWKRNDALAGDRRRANEEANLTLAGNNYRLGLGRGSSQLHDDDDCGSGCDGRDRVHCDAELAMIGVALARVQVRDLSNGERGQKDEAQDGDGGKKAGRDAGRDATSGAAWYALGGAAFAAENSGESRHGACQSQSLLCDLQLLFYRRLTEVWTRRV